MGIAAHQALTRFVLEPKGALLSCAVCPWQGFTAGLADGGAESLKFVSQHLQLKCQDILLLDYCLHLLGPKPTGAVAGPVPAVQATTDEILLVDQGL